MKRYNLENGDILLDAGRGKYSSGLLHRVYSSNVEELLGNSRSGTDFYTYENQYNSQFGGEYTCQTGKYVGIKGFLSQTKKGRVMFTPHKNGNHLYTEISWSGDTNHENEELQLRELGVSIWDEDGNFTPDNDAGIKFYRYRRSNGGGAGIEYLIFDLNHQVKLSLDDF